MARTTRSLAAAAALFALALPGAAAGATHCRGMAGEPALTSRTAVVRVDRNYEDRDVWRACWKATGRVARLAVVPLDVKGRAIAYVAGFQQHSAWLAWGRYATRTGALSTLQSLNLRTGNAGQRVQRPLAGDQTVTLGPTDGPLPNLDPPYYALASNGSFGWLAQGASPTGQNSSAVYVPDGSGGSRRIALRRGSSSIQRLGTRGTTLRWTAGGRRHSYSLSTARP
jgi:hypothetical protein